MPIDHLDLTIDEFRDLTGWEIKPEGACRDERCVPLPATAATSDGRVDVTAVAERLGMPIAHDEQHGLWAVGPESGGRRVLDDVEMPDLVLPDFDGNTFDFATLRGRKVALIAWASW
jgi:hypothetical protein